MSTTYKRRKIVIGLFGFGTVGKGLWEVLNTTPALHASIKKICIKNGHKEREAPQLLFTTSAEEILKDGEINVVVELIDDAQAAFEIVKLALENGKDVVSANKKMIAENFETLVDLQRKFGGSLLYEGACCASIPVIRNLEEYYDNDMLTSIEGIINGSTNYILSSLAGSNISFREALLEAQQLGYAESNPVLDIEGHDAANKLSLLIAHGFGKIQPPGELLYAGINNIRATDTKLAKEKGLSIKLVATAKKLKQGNLAAFVLPQFVGKDNELFHVHDVYNGLVTESSFADKHFFKGKGAGAFPTAAAVLSDISALQYNYRYEYKKLGLSNTAPSSPDYFLKVYVSADDIANIDLEKFEWIDEWHNEHNNAWVSGGISAGSLQENRWWQVEGVSLILNESPVMEDISYKAVQKESLRLAGVLEHY